MNRSHAPSIWGAGLLMALLATAAWLATSWPAGGPGRFAGAGIDLTTRAGHAPAALPSAVPRFAPPLQFEPNRGQAANGIRYLARGPRHQVAIFGDGMSVAQLGQPAAQLRFIGAGTGTGMGGDVLFEERAPALGVSHHLLGMDEARWQRHVPRFRQLRRPGLYPGIDLVYYSREGEFEFDLVVQPGADPSVIRLLQQGTRAAAIDSEGRLRLDGGDGQLMVKRPVLYQHIDGQRITLDAQWVRHADGSFGFALPAYDRSRVLVIDPVFKLQYATYLGGVHDDAPEAMTLDAQGNVYVVGQSASEDWPVSGNALQRTRKNLGRYAYDVVVSKFDPAGTLLWSTFYGGLQDEHGRAIRVDAAGRVIIAGDTASDDLPTTAGALQRTRRGATDGFVAVLSPDGSVLEQATYFGGTGGTTINALALAGQGRLMAAGSAGAGLATTAGAYKPTLATGKAAFVARFTGVSAGPLQLQAASYYGTDNPEANSQVTGNLAYALALDAQGAPWITGQAFTTRLPLSANAVRPAPTAIDTACVLNVDPLNSFAYVAKLSADLATLSYATYLSGNVRNPGRQACSEYAAALHVDTAGDVYVVGSTASDRFPTTPGALQGGYPGNGLSNSYAGHVTKLRGDGGAILWSSYLGGSRGNTFLNSMAPGAEGSLWLGSTTEGGDNFPLSTDAIQRTFGGGAFDGGFHRLDAGTGALRYGSLIGGAGTDGLRALRDDGAGNVVLAGTTESLNFPVTAGAFQPAYGRGDAADWFLAIVGGTSIGSVRPTRAGAGGSVTLTVVGLGFEAGATAVLVGPTGSRIAAAAGEVDAAGGRFSFTMPTTASGAHDLEVTLADGTVVRRAAALDVANVATLDINVQVIGRPTIRTGVPATFQITVTNDGNVDAFAIPLWISVPENVVVRFQGNEWPAGGGGVNRPFGDGRLMLLSTIIGRLAPGASETVSLQIIAPQAFDAIPISAAVQAPWFRTVEAVHAYATRTSFPTACVPDPQDGRFVDCSGLFKAYLALGTPAVLDFGPEIPGLTSTVLAKGGAQATVPLDASTHALYEGCKAHKDNPKAKTNPYKSNRFLNLPRGTPFCPEPDAETLKHDDWEQGYAHGETVPAAACIEPASASMSLKTDQSTRQASSDCTKPPDLPKPPRPAKPPAVSKPGSAGAIDPNDIYGLPGDSSAGHFLRSVANLPYQIAFENQATAGLAAAEVVVTDQLDPAKFDLSTLCLGDVAWGAYRIAVPPGRNSYATTFSVSPALSVRVAGSLNTSTGMLKWTFTTLDPTTHLPPSDPTLGFLPPNRNGTEGQAYVNFTIAPKAGLPEGTRWENSASIVFDANAPIATPTWVNTLDSTAPVSRVSVATQRAGSAELEVSWSGSDAGSGARRYTVWMSEDGGPFTAWQADTAATSAILLSSRVGHRYGFYVVATDGAGNVEASKSAAEASVTVSDATGGSSASGGGGGCTVVPGGAGGGRGDASLVLLLAAALGVLWRRHGPGLLRIPHGLRRRAQASASTTRWPHRARG